MAISDYTTLTSLTDDVVMPLANASTTYSVLLDTMMEDMRDGMLSANFGEDNAGKVLMVGADGVVRPTEYEE